jgi:hypothetical protein
VNLDLGLVTGLVGATLGTMATAMIAALLLR